MTVLLPLRTVSVTNLREHWSARAVRAKSHRMIAKTEVVAALRGSRRHDRVTTVTLTRLAPRALDGDNLQAALKAVRDGVADALKLSDGPDGPQWRYAQEQQATYGVRIAVESLEE